jgi:hypothetical protein
MFHHEPSTSPEIGAINYKVEVRPLSIGGEHTHKVQYDKHAIVRLDLAEIGRNVTHKNKGVEKTAPTYAMTVLNACIPKPEKGHGIKDPTIVVEGLVKQFKGELVPVRYKSSETGDQFSVLFGVIGHHDDKPVVRTLRKDSNGNNTPLLLNKGSIKINFYLLYIHNYNNAIKHGSWFVEVELLYNDLEEKAQRHVFHVETEVDKYGDTIAKVYADFLLLKNVDTKEGHGKIVDGYKRNIRYHYTGAYTEGALVNTTKERAKAKMDMLLEGERIFIARYSNCLLSAFLAFTRYYDLMITVEEERYFEYFQKRRVAWNEMLEFVRQCVPTVFVG